MLYTLVVVLLILWLLGLITKYTLGGLRHILLVIAIILLIIRLVTGRRVVWLRRATWKNRIGTQPPDRADRTLTRLVASG